VARWHSLPSDPGASFDRELALDAAARLSRLITYGTNPGWWWPMSGSIPELAGDDAVFDRRWPNMGLTAGAPIGGQPVNGRVPSAAATNGRLSDLRGAARLLRGTRSPARRGAR